MNVTKVFGSPNSKLCEKMVAMNDYGDALLSRIFSIQKALYTEESSRARFPTLYNLDYLKIKKKLDQGLPDINIDISKMSNYDLFHNQSSLIIKEFMDFFQTIRDSMEFQKTAIDLLHQLLSAEDSPWELSFYKYRSLFIHTMQLICHVAKIESIWQYVVFPQPDASDHHRNHSSSKSIIDAKDDPRKSMLAIFIAAHHAILDRRSDQLFSKLIQFIDDSHSSTSSSSSSTVPGSLRSLTMQLIPYHERLSMMILEVDHVIRTSHNFDTLRQRNAFNPLADGMGLALPIQKTMGSSMNKFNAKPGNNASVGAGSNNPMNNVNGRMNEMANLHFEIMTGYNLYCEFVIWSVTLSPLTLSDPMVLDLFRYILQSEILLPIHRNNVLNIHSVLDDLISWFPTKGMTTSLPKGFKLKPIVKDLVMIHNKKETKETNIWMTAVEQHRFAACNIELEFKNILNLMTNVPGLLAPKLPMCLALARMANQEIIWFMRHAANARKISPSGKSIPNISPDMYISSHAVQLIGCVSKLEILIKNNSDLIEQYYIEYITGAHLTTTQNLISELKQQKLGLTPEEDLLLDSIPSYLANYASEENRKPVYKQLTSTWSRLCVNLANSIRMSHFKAIPQLVDRMNTICEHVDYVDNLEQVFAKNCSLSQLFWYRQSFQEAFAEVTETARYSISENFIGFLSATASTLNNINPLFVDEQEHLREKVVEIADTILEQICNHLEDKLERFYRARRNLSKQCSSIKVITRLKSQLDAKEHGKVSKEKPLPGNESKIPNAYEIHQIAALHHNIVNICSVLARTSTVSIVSKKYNLEEMVRDRIYRAYRRHMQLFFTTEIPYPSVALAKALEYAEGIQLCAQFFSFDAVSIIREILLETCYGTSAASSSAFVSSSNAVSINNNIDDLDSSAYIYKDQGKPLSRISAWFTNFLDKLAKGDRDIVYSEARKCFIYKNTGVNIDQKDDILESERYTDALELTALSTLIGVHGMEHIDRDVVQYIETNLQEVYVFLEHNKLALEDFKVRYRSVQPSKNKRMLGFGSFTKFIAAMKKIGNAVALRELLLNAIKVTQKEYCPSIPAHFKNVIDSIEMKNLDHNQLKFFHYQARNVGFNTHDNRLLKCINAISSSNKSLWQLLPYACAASLIDPVWGDVQYNARHDSYRKNEHLFFKAMLEILIVIRNDVLNKEYHSIIDQGMVDCLAASSLLLLKMKVHSQEEFKTYKFDHLIAILEKYVKWCPVLDHGIMEQYLPYAMIHRCFTEISYSERDDNRVGEGGDHHHHKNKTDRLSLDGNNQTIGDN